MSCGFPIDVHGHLRPCGKCQGCLRRRRRGWVGRMLVENAACGGESAFVTLTYSDADLPLVWSGTPEGDGTWIPTLEKSHAKNWVRSVRRKATAIGLPRRWFMAGEYGTKTGRPHLHVILFGIGPTWASRFEDCWTRGFQSWYPATVRSMAYVAKYCLKHGRDPELELGVDEHQRKSVAPFRLMSRNPPIGGDVVDKIVAAISKTGGPEVLLEADKMLKELRIGGQKYPMDRTIRERLARELVSLYALDETTLDRMLSREAHEPTEREIQEARAAHIRAREKGRARHKL